MAKVGALRLGGGVRSCVLNFVNGRVGDGRSSNKLHQDPAALTSRVEVEREARAAYSIESLDVVRYRSEKICDHCISPAACLVLCTAYCVSIGCYCFRNS